MHNSVFGLYHVHYELRFVFVLFLIIYVNNQLRWKRGPPSVLFSRRKQKASLSFLRLCFVGDTQWLDLKAKSLYNLLFPQVLLYIPALIGDSFHPLSSSACDDMLLFLHSERTLRTSVPVFIHTAVSLLSPLREVKPSYSLLTLDLDFWLSPAVALFRGLNNTWIYPSVIKKRAGVEGCRGRWRDLERLVPTTLRRFLLPIKCNYLVSAALQRDWDLPQRHQSDPVWQSRVLHHRIRYAPLRLFPLRVLSQS